MESRCGGFGIRNFLTLGLSIEVNKAMFEGSSEDVFKINQQFEASQEENKCTCMYIVPPTN